MKQTLLCLSLLLVVNVVKGHDAHTLTTASSFFSQILYQKLALNETTVAFSPYSIHAILSMLTLGANGETQTELLRALSLDSLSLDYISKAYQALLTELSCIKDIARITSVNIILVPPAQQVLQIYSDILKTYFFTGVGRYNLQSVGGAETPINQFVERKTSGCITNLIPNGFITQDTSLLALSVFQFNATWKEPFLQEKSTDKDFNALCGEASQVRMLNSDRYVNARRNILGANVIELPFTGDRVSLYLALPAETENINTLESALTNPNNFRELFTGLSPVYSRISIPKFKVQSKFQLSGPLQQLGVVRAFDSRYAEFQGISQNSLHVSQVVHSTDFEITECGTYNGPPEAPRAQNLPGIGLEFKADRPFLFFLRDNVSQQLLLQGKYSG